MRGAPGRGRNVVPCLLGTLRNPRPHEHRTIRALPIAHRTSMAHDGAAGKVSHTAAQALQVDGTLRRLLPARHAAWQRRSHLTAYISRQSNVHANVQLPAANGLAHGTATGSYPAAGHLAGAAHPAFPAPPAHVRLHPGPAQPTQGQAPVAYQPPRSPSFAPRMAPRVSPRDDAPPHRSLHAPQLSHTRTHVTAQGVARIAQHVACRAALLGGRNAWANGTFADLRAVRAAAEPPWRGRRGCADGRRRAPSRAQPAGQPAAHAPRGALHAPPQGRDILLTRTLASRRPRSSGHARTALPHTPPPQPPGLPPPLRPAALHGGRAARAGQPLPAARRPPRARLGRPGWRRRAAHLGGSGGAGPREQGGARHDGQRLWLRKRAACFVFPSRFALNGVVRVMGWARSRCGVRVRPPRSAPRARRAAWRAGSWAAAEEEEGATRTRCAGGGGGLRWGRRRL